MHAPALDRPRLLRQRWCDVAFLHWAVDPAAVAGLLPPGVRPDVLDGRTYVGLVPFRMVGTALAAGPAVPWAGTFLETNVRLYSVDATGRRGVVFLSLDADRAVAVAAARAGFGLPYRWSRMRFTAEGAERRYTTRVRWPGPRCGSDVAVRVGGPAPDGPLERFLTARWGLHVARFGRTWFLPNAHPPWPLRTAEVLVLDDDLVAAAASVIPRVDPRLAPLRRRSTGHALGMLAGRPPDHVVFSDGVAATFGPPVPVTRP